MKRELTLREAFEAGYRLGYAAREVGDEEPRWDPEEHYELWMSRIRTSDTIRESIFEDPERDLSVMGTVNGWVPDSPWSVSDE